MTREDFVEYLKTTGLDFTEAKTIPGYDKDYDGIYILGRESKLKKAHPRKHKNLFVPYLRVSNFDGDWYIRYNGLTKYSNVTEVMNIIDELKGR